MASLYYFLFKFYPATYNSNSGFSFFHCHCVYLFRNTKLLNLLLFQNMSYIIYGKSTIAALLQIFDFFFFTFWFFFYILSRILVLFGNSNTQSNDHIVQSPSSAVGPCQKFHDKSDQLEVHCRNSLALSTLLLVKISCGLAFHFAMGKA